MFLQSKDEIQKVFNRFDTNQDGKISADELGGVLKALGSDTSAEEVSRMMDEIDTDHDGAINLDEFASFCAREDAYSSGEKELHEAFEMYDQDHDGKISASELHQILTRIGERCSIEDCGGMIKTVDSDGDGYVSFEEFKMMMTNKTSSAAATHVKDE